MTFGQYVDLLRALTQLPLETYFPLAVLVIPGWMLWAALFKPLVIEGSPWMLALGGAAVVLFGARLWDHGLSLFALALLPVLVLVGREAYRRLLS